MTETPAEPLPPLTPVDGALPEEAMPETAAPELHPPEAKLQAGAEAPDPLLPTDAETVSDDLPASPQGSAEPVRAAPIPDLAPAACAALLSERFPALFSAGRALPLKLRIQADIQQRAPGLFNKKSLSIFLHRYTTGNAYLKALAQAPHRFDLDGQPAGEVNDEHRSAAVTELERRKAIFEDRRHLEREQQREAALAARRAQAAQQAARHAAHDAAEAEGRRDRAGVLRAFEATTLTTANFCALKGLVEAELPALLERARQERAQRATEPQSAPRPDRPGRPRQTQEPRRDGGGPPRNGPREGRAGPGSHGPRTPRKPSVKP
jgi:sRNA-binding protein